MDSYTNNDTSELSMLGGFHDENAEAIEGLKLVVETNTTNIDDNTAAIALNTTAIGTIQGDIETLGDALGEVEVNTNNNMSLIDDNTAAIAVNSAKVGLSPTQITDIALVDGINTRLYTAEGYIGANNLKIDVVEADIATNLASINSHTTSIATNLTSINSHTTSIATNLANTTINTTNISTNTSGVANSVKKTGETSQTIHGNVNTTGEIGCNSFNLEATDSTAQDYKGIMGKSDTNYSRFEMKSSLGSFIDMKGKTTGDYNTPDFGLRMLASATGAQINTTAIPLTIYTTGSSGIDINPIGGNTYVYGVNTFLDSAISVKQTNPNAYLMANGDFYAQKKAYFKDDIIHRDTNNNLFTMLSSDTVSPTQLKINANNDYNDTYIVNPILRFGNEGSRQPLLNVCFELYNSLNPSTTGQWLKQTGVYNNANTHFVQKIMFPFKWRIAKIVGYADIQNVDTVDWVYQIHNEGNATPFISDVKIESMETGRVKATADGAFDNINTIGANAPILIKWAISSGSSISSNIHKIYGYQCMY